MTRAAAEANDLATSTNDPKSARYEPPEVRPVPSPQLPTRRRERRRPAGVIIDVAGDGRQRGAESGWRLGLDRGGERDEQPIVDLGVEDGDADAVAGRGVVVGVREPADQPVEAEPAGRS